MRLSIFLITIILLSTHILFSTYSLADETSTKLDVGLLLPLSGPLAEYGIAFQNGVELAKKDSSNINQNCNFITEDSKYDAKVTVTGFKKLSKVDKAPVIYTWGGPTSEAVAPLADPSDVALFVWSADPGVAEKRKNVIRFCNSGREYAAPLASHLNTQGYKKIGIVKTENQYINTILDGLIEVSGDKFDIEVIDTYLPTEQDFRATITKIGKKHYDAIGIFLLSGQVSNFARKLKQQGIKKPLFGTDFFESMTEVKLAEGALKDAIFSNNDVSQQFRKTYIDTYKNDYQINHAANGYDFANFLCKVVKPKLTTTSASSIIRASADANEYIGAQGKTKFTTNASKDKSFPFPVVVRVIDDANIKTMKNG